MYFVHVTQNKLDALKSTSI